MVDALEARRRLRGAAHPGTVNAMYQLGLLYLDLGHNEDAAAKLAEAVTLTREKKPQGKASFGSLLTAQGRALTRLAKHEEAEVVLLEAFALVREAAGETHRRTVEAAKALAELYQ